jgi:hypothetical protein
MTAVREITHEGADFTLESRAGDGPAPGEFRRQWHAHRRQAHHRHYRRCEGESKADFFIPGLVELYKQGRFPFNKLVKFYTLDQTLQNKLIAFSLSTIQEAELFDGLTFGGSSRDRWKLGTIGLRAFQCSHNAMHPILVSLPQTGKIAFTLIFDY